MRKLLTALGVATGLVAVGLAQASPRDEAATRTSIYLSYSFGAAHHPGSALPLRYGLRVDAIGAEARGGFVASATPALPALAQFEGDFRGNSVARLGGLPFAGHVAALRQNDADGAAPAADSGGATDSGAATGDSSAASGSSDSSSADAAGNSTSTDTSAADGSAAAPDSSASAGADTSNSEGGSSAANGGFTWFDWGLLALGAGGLAYVAIEATRGKESHDPPPNANAKNAATGARFGFAATQDVADEDFENPAGYRRQLESGAGFASDLVR